jgi:hypothetical protein
MATLEQLYAPGEMRTPLEPDEQLRHSFILTQGRLNWTRLHYEATPGVWYHAHLTNQRLILEASLGGPKNLFLHKALTVGLTLVAWRLGAPRAMTKTGGALFQHFGHAEQAAQTVGDQTLAIPLSSLKRAEKSSAWVRLVMSNPPPGFDPHSLVFMAAPLPGRRGFRTGWATAADAVELINRALRDCPSDATIVS